MTIAQAQVQADARMAALNLAELDLTAVYDFADDLERIALVRLGVNPGRDDVERLNLEWQHAELAVPAERFPS